MDDFLKFLCIIAGSMTLMAAMPIWIPYLIKKIRFFHKETFMFSYKIIDVEKFVSSGVEEIMRPAFYRVKNDPNSMSRVRELQAFGYKENIVRGVLKDCFELVTPGVESRIKEQPRLKVTLLKSFIGFGKKEIWYQDTENNSANGWIRYPDGKRDPKKMGAKLSAMLTVYMLDHEQEERLLNS